MKPSRPDNWSSARIKTEVGEAQDYDAGENIKCGNIYMTNNRKYTYVCEFCGQSFEDMPTFGHHLDEKHFRPEEAPTDNNLTGTNSFTVNNANGEPEFTVYYLDEPAGERPPVDNDTELPGHSTEVPSNHQESMDDDDNLLVPLEPYTVARNHHPTSTRPVSQHNRASGQPADQTSLEYSGIVAKIERGDCSLLQAMSTEQYMDTEQPAMSFYDSLFDPNFDDDQWFCYLCNRQFKAKYAFTKHKNWHKGGEKTEIAGENVHCNLCNRTYKSMPAMRRHALRDHGNKIPNALENDRIFFSCVFCNKRFGKPLERRKHERSHKEEYPYTCLICSKKFKMKHYRTAHMSTVHFKRRVRGSVETLVFNDIANPAEPLVEFSEEPVAQPDDDDFQMDALQELNEHTDEDGDEEASLVISDTEDERHEESESNTIDVFYCDICSEGFMDRESLKNHKMTHEHEKPQSYDASMSNGFLCDLCGHWVKSIKFFKNHAWQQHGDVIPQMLEHDPTYRSCTYCHKNFKRVTDRVNHERTHTDESAFVCQFCPMTFKLQRDRYFHIHSHHTDIRPYKCPHCPQKFVKYMTYVLHVKTHLGVIRVKCQYCEERFDNADFADHVRTQHVDQWPYECKVCGERFKQRSRLVYHEGKHENGLAFQCDVCHKGFYTKNHLKAHRVCHSANRPYKCRQCPARFKTRDNLTKHSRRHPELNGYMKQKRAAYGTSVN